MTIDERLDRIDQSMTEMRQEMARYARDHSAENAALRTEIAALTGHVQELRTDNAALTRHVQELRTENTALTRYVQGLRTETISRLEIIDTRMTLLAAGLTSLESRMLPFTKALLDFGEVANRLQIEQSRIARLVEPAA